MKNNYKLKSGDDYSGKIGNGKDYRVSQGNFKGSYKNEIYGKAASSLLDSCDYNSISSGQFEEYPPHDIVSDRLHYYESFNN